MRRPVPDDPVVRRLIQQAGRLAMSRRTMLAGAGGGAVALALAACSTAASGGPDPADDRSAQDPTLAWTNWPAYLDEVPSGAHPTLQRFRDESGIDVDYRADIEDNNTYFRKVRDRLARGQDIGADLVCLSDWMTDRWIRHGYAQELDHGNIPNRANLKPRLADVAFDRGRVHSLPWQGGFAGICWNTEHVPDGIRTVADLWRPEFAGRVGVLSEMRDTVGLIMMDQGVDIAADFTEAQFASALDVFRQNVENGQIRSVSGSSYLDDLVSEEILVSICWSGDIRVLNARAEGRWEFAIPEGGGTRWNDNFLVPVGSARKSNAERLIDYYYDPAVAAEVAAWLGYVTPVLGAQEAMTEIAPELAEDPLIFPDEELLARVSTFRPLDAAEEQSFSTAFQAVLLGA